MLGLEEFVTGMLSLFTHKFDNLVNTIFNIYDFEKKGKINRENIRLIFSFIPLSLNLEKPIFLKSLSNTESNRIFENRLRSQEEIFNLLEKIFKDQTYLDNAKFNEIISNVSSELFLYVK